MRIVDFKELLTLPAHTFFSVVDCNAARHSAIVKDVYSKLSTGHEGLSFHGDKVNVLEGYEFALPQIATAFVRNESINIPAMTRKTQEFLFANYGSIQFAVWEKKEIEELMEKFRKALAVFPKPKEEPEHPFGVTVTGLR